MAGLFIFWFGCCLRVYLVMFGGLIVYFLFCLCVLCLLVCGGLFAFCGLFVGCCFVVLAC